MILIQPNAWVKEIYPLEKFLTEKIIQRSDCNESITNKHRTTNGYIQLKELLTLSKLSLTRARTVRTVKVLIEEAKSDLFTQNIKNDIIVNAYFKDLRDFIVSYDSTRLENDGKPNLVEINTLIYKLSLFESQLERGYFMFIGREFFAIDYKEIIKVDRHAKMISALVDILIPYLAFKGYAISSISEVLRSWISKGYRATFRRMFKFFNFRKREYSYVIKTGKKTSEEWTFLLRLMRDEQGIDVTLDTAGKLKVTRPDLHLFQDDDVVAIYSNSDLDPHTHFRNIYDSSLKRVVLTRERHSLASFNEFFDSCYWRSPKRNKQLHKVEFTNDPLNVNSRSRTLRNTLVDNSFSFGYSFNDETLIPNPENEQLRNSLYYYNLALGSKSIENSLALLWTSLEALLPYRTHFSDIECVQHFVSKSISLGSLGRDIRAFVMRLLECNSANGGVLDPLEIAKLGKCNSPETLERSYNWITVSTKATIDERFALIKTQSELLAFEYYRIARPLIEGKYEYLHKRISASNLSIKYQLQRIYLHRNQIIHAGNIINEYSNLWIHLEWYIGKLLAHSIINLEITKRHATLYDLFISTESDYDYVVSYFEKNIDKPITDLSTRIRNIIFGYSWQSF
jgi:hypothetical protein